MKNKFVLKNIKNDLNRTESEHENIGGKKAENQSKLSETVPQTPQPSSSSSSWDVGENTPTQSNESVYRSKQPLHRSVKRVEKYLPSSPKKKRSTQQSGKQIQFANKIEKKRGPKKNNV